MRKLALSLLVLMLLSLPVLAADLVAIPASQVPSCGPLVTEMSACVKPEPVSLEVLNQSSLTVPMQMPVRVHKNLVDGSVSLQPLVVTAGVPADAVMMPINVPVRFAGTPTETCLTATLDTDLADTTLLMPASVNGQVMLEPVTLKRERDHLTVLPASMSVAAGGYNVPMYINGEMSMFPLNCRRTADGINFCPTCPAGEVILLRK